MDIKQSIFGEILASEKSMVQNAYKDYGEFYED